MQVNTQSVSHLCTPLYIAAENGHTEVVKLFSGNKAEANASVHTASVTPVCVASEKDQRVKPPLTKKDKMNAGGADMDTSRHTASVMKPSLAKKDKMNAGGADMDTSRHTASVMKPSLAMPVYVASKKERVKLPLVKKARLEKIDIIFKKMKKIRLF